MRNLDAADNPLVNVLPLKSLVIADITIGHVPNVPCYQAQELKIAISPRVLSYDGCAIESIIWSGDGAKAAVIDSQGRVYLNDGPKIMKVDDFELTHINNQYMGRHYSDVAIGPNGHLYFARVDREDSVYDQSIRSITSSGEVNWTYDLNGDYDFGTPAIDANGNIYIVNGIYLWAFDPDGNRLWRNTVSDVSGENSLSDFITIASDGTIYVNAYLEDKLYAVSANGEVVNQVGLAGDLTAPVSIDSQGHLYVVTGNVIEVLDSQLNKLWQYQANDSISHSVLIDGQNNSYIANGSAIDKLDSQGQLQWQLNRAQGEVKSITLADDDGLYAVIDNTVYLFDLRGELKSYHPTGLDKINYMALSDNGLLYFGSDTYSHAISTTTMGLATVPWPRQGQNNFNSSLQGGQGTTTHDGLTVDAGDNKVVISGSEVSLNASTNNAGQETTYLWSQVRGTSVSLTDQTTATVNFTAPTLSQEQRLSFIVKVSNANGSTSYDSVEVSVSPMVEDNIAPLLSVEDFSTNELAQVSLASTTGDEDGYIYGYTWSQVSGPAVDIYNANRANASFYATDQADGTVYGFEIEVVDNNGATQRATLYVTTLG